MTKVFGFIFLIIVVFSIWAGVKWKDEGPGKYITNIRFFSAAILFLLLAIGFLTTDKSFCELVPFVCR